MFQFIDNHKIYLYILIPILFFWFIQMQHQFTQTGGNVIRAEGQPCDVTNPCKNGLECYRNVCVLGRSDNDFYSDLQS